MPECVRGVGVPTQGLMAVHPQYKVRPACFALQHFLVAERNAGETCLHALIEKSAAGARLGAGFIKDRRGVPATAGGTGLEDITVHCRDLTRIVMERMGEIPIRLIHAAYAFLAVDVPDLDRRPGYGQTNPYFRTITAQLQPLFQFGYGCLKLVITVIAHGVAHQTGADAHGRGRIPGKIQFRQQIRYHVRTRSHVDRIHSAMRGVFLDSDTLKPEELELMRLEQSGPDWSFYGHTMPEEVSERIAEAEVVITNKVVLDRARIEAALNLQLICVAATGTNNVDLDAAREHGVAVCNVTGYATPSVAQHTLALMLGLATRWRQYHADVRQGVWSGGHTFCRLDYPVVELAGKTLGIVGYGTLGRAVADLGRALGMKVVVAQSLAPGAAHSGERVELEELLSRSDVVSLHCPQTPATQKLINADTLARVKTGALLVNTARGGLIEPRALLDALNQGRLGGAALDVLEQEPPPADHPLINADHPNLIITPHNAWVSRDCRQRLLDGIADNIRSWRSGALRNCVNGLTG